MYLVKPHPLFPATFVDGKLALGVQMAEYNQELMNPLHAEKGALD